MRIMPFQDSPPLRYYTFENLSRYGVVHGVFTRRGGVSPAPWASLNMGATVGDEWERVQENIRRAFSALGLPVESRYDSWLVHGKEAVYAAEPRPVSRDSSPQKADIITTDQPAVTLVMRFADCVPILLYDPRRQALALAHAGWKGTVIGVARAAVEAMAERFGSKPADLLAAIGPAIGPNHYEIGAEVAEQVQNAFGAEAERLLPKRNGSIFFDLWEANRLTLRLAGVPDEQIEVARICTAANLQDWYSHRAEHGKTGRFGVLAALPR